MTFPLSQHTDQPVAAVKNRILVVDDEAAILFAYCKLIEAEGFEVNACENIYEAMALIRIFPYLAVITDVRMGGTDNEDGIKLLRFIKEMQPEARIIVFSGQGTQILKQKVFELGASNYFEKPVNPSVIISIIDDLIRSVQSTPMLVEPDADI